MSLVNFSVPLFRFTCTIITLLLCPLCTFTFTFTCCICVHLLCLNHLVSFCNCFAFLVLCFRPTGLAHFTLLVVTFVICVPFVFFLIICAALKVSSGSTPGHCLCVICRSTYGPSLVFHLLWLGWILLQIHSMLIFHIEAFQRPISRQDCSSSKQDK